MSDGFLSQEEIDSLLNGGSSSSESGSNSENDSKSESDNKSELTDVERDLLGEVGNISMGSASTALSTLLNQPVNITTPVVEVTTLDSMKSNLTIPNVALDVKFISGIDGENLLVIKVPDACVIANLMMGGDGKTQNDKLSEIEISAVSEAMNQMIGSAATSMATMFEREVNISPPNCRIWDDTTVNLADDISDSEEIVMVSFKLTIGDLVDSTIMQVLPIATAKKIVSIMMGEKEEKAEEPKETIQQPAAPAPAPSAASAPSPSPAAVNYNYGSPQPQYQTAAAPAPRVEVKQASFQPLQEVAIQSAPKNIDLILDVPLEISVVLGRTKKNIKDILNFGTGSLIELDKLAEEPVEIMVNGKKVAYGEVVVVDENFGVRITSIVSNAERIKSLGNN